MTQENQPRSHTPMDASPTTPLVPAPHTAVDSSETADSTTTSPQDATASHEVTAETSQVAEHHDNLPPTPPRKRRGCWSIFWHLLKAMVRHWRITLFFIVVILLGYGGMTVYRNLTTTDTATAQPIASSPEEVVQLKAIGQWEFLSVEAEELVERHNAGLMSERDLVCIYRGTLRIGIDMHKLSPDWMVVEGKNVVLHLPQPSLLDENFLDESRTTVFFEQGVFRPDERKALTEEAKAKMKQRALTPDNLSIARRNAEEQLQKLLLAMGYQEVVVDFTAPSAQQ